MSRLRTRVLKLEAAQPKTVEQLVIVFSIIDSDCKPIQVIGYSFSLGTVMRLSNESQEVLKERAMTECQQTMPDSLVIVLHPLIEV